jgi:uncharacterized protein YprB with RNaseH-like and TPR domain
VKDKDKLLYCLYNTKQALKNGKRKKVFVPIDDIDDYEHDMLWQMFIKYCFDGDKDAYKKAVEHEQYWELSLTYEIE